MSRLLIFLLLVLLTSCGAAPAVQSTPVPVIGEAVTSPPLETTAPEPTATTISTEAPAPTTAPEPTATVIPTVAPVTTAVPGLSEEARAYFAAAAGPIGEYGKWYGVLGEQSSKAGENPALVLDDAWKVDTAVAITGLREAASQLDALDASGTEAAEIGRLVQQIVDETGPLTDEYTRGVDDFDASLISAAGRRMQTIAGLITQMNAEMGRLQP